MNIITSALYSKAHIQEYNGGIRLFIDVPFLVSASSLVAVKIILILGYNLDFLEIYNLYSYKLIEYNCQTD